MSYETTTRQVTGTRYVAPETINADGTATREDIGFGAIFTILLVVGLLAVGIASIGAL